MDDVAFYTAYYSHYHARATEVAEIPASTKHQSAVCAFLVFGAACGLATVLVGFFAHNPAIIWPVVAAGLIGAIGGLIMAHRKATGGWVWGPGPSAARASSQPGHTAQNPVAAVAGRAATVAIGDGGPYGYQLPMYCACVVDVEVGPMPHPPHPLPSSALPFLPSCATTTTITNIGNKVAAPGGKFDAPCAYGGGCSDSGGGGSYSGSSGDSDSVCGGCGGLEMTKPAGAGASGPAPAAAAAATAAEYGTVVCGVPLARPDGWIDTRPVLVLQPHSQLLSQLQPLPQPQPSGQPWCPGCVVEGPSRRLDPVLCREA